MGSRSGACTTRSRGAKGSGPRSSRRLRPQRVVVVGGGPAGLEAARVAALRGHRVVLLEASGRLGGQLHLAARLPKRENFLEIVSFLSRQTAKLGVEVRLGCRADVDTVRAERPDTVVVATGSRPAMPDGLCGAPGSLVHVANVVSGEARVGDRVLVVDQDGHLRGSGVADLLAGQGRRVSIVSEQLYVGQGIDLKTLYPLQRRLREQGVEMLPSTRFVGWDAGRPLVADVFTGAERTLADVDTVVWAAAGRVVADLIEPLRASGLPVYPVGDCVAPRRVEHAVHEAHAVARGL